MSGPLIAAIVARFDSRLATLQGLLDKAAMQWRDVGKSPETLVDAKLADDMAPLGRQIAFVCNQPGSFLDWATATTVATDVPASVADMTALIAATRARLAAFDGDDALLAREKIVSLPGDLAITFTGATYIDDWILPNFYFHLVTAYAILRSQGVVIGKADYMAHLAAQVRPRTA